MVSMKRQLARRSRSSSSRQSAKASRWISRRVFELNSVWLTEGREKMRKAAIFSFVLILSGLGSMAATAADKPAGRFLANDLHRHERLRQAALQVRLRAPGISGRSAVPGVRRDAAR